MAIEPPGNSRSSFIEKLKTRPRSFWAFVLVILGLNIWWDFYHPLGILLDVVLLTYFLCRAA